MLETSRRGLLTGLVSLIAAPAIVHVANIMPVKAVDYVDHWVPVHGPQLGELWFDLTSRTLQFFNGSSWQSVTCAALARSRMGVGDRVTSYVLAHMKNLNRCDL